MEKVNNKKISNKKVNNKKQTNNRSTVTTGNKSSTSSTRNKSSTSSTGNKSSTSSKKKPVVNKESSDIVKKDKIKRRGRLIIDRQVDDGYQEHKYNEELSLLVSKIRDRSMIDSEDKIRFAWK